MNLRDLKLRARALLTPGRVERELDEELAFHLDREMQKHLAGGCTEQEARRRARASFGPVPLIADECRDQRGTTFVDSTLRDVRYAFRSFARTPLAALTIVGTVALGLGLVAVVFTFFNAFFYRVDAVRNPDELFAIREAAHAGASSWIQHTRRDYDALRRETGVFTDIVGAVRGIGTRIGGRSMNATLVTGNFFQVLGATAAHGRTLTAADELPSAALVIVLSHRGAGKLFGTEASAVGQTLLVNGVRAEVVGVMPPGFRGLSLGAPDYWAPLGLAGQIRRAYVGKENDLRLEIIGRLKPGISQQLAVVGLTMWRSARSDGPSAGDKPAYFRLAPRRGTVGDDAGEALLVFSPLFFAFGLILLTGCANVANLLLARGVARQREIGIRLSLGASRRRVVRQLLTESLILAIAAAAGALAMSRILLEATLYALLTTMPPEIAETMMLDVPPVDWRVLAFLVAGATLSTVFFGLTPALQATRIELVRAMRGELTRDARPGRARNILVALQVTASALLLISAGVFLRSALSAAVDNPGVRTSDTVVVDVDTESLRPAMLQALGADPAVAAVTASSPHGLALPPAAFAAGLSSSIRSSVGYRFVSATYFDVLDIQLFKGRTFASAERTDAAGVVVLSESTARRFWPDRDAIGESIRLESPAPAGVFTVVGIVRDTGNAVRGPHPDDPVVYLPTSLDTAGTALTLRVHGDPERARHELTDRLTRIDPALGTIMTMRTMAGLEAYLLGAGFWMTVVLGVLALALTLSGLFSVLSYLVEQRKREIGVRLALGATGGGVARLIVAQSFRPVLIGLVTGATLAAAVATLLLTTPYASLVDNVEVLDPAAYAGSLICIVLACAAAAVIPASRAARIDPIATLRQD